jgi:2',3'-cyclic-nucleotide 2'-phosphodiesterase (5'-nucleotidase family)
MNSCFVRLRRAGADKVVMPAHLGAERIAEHLGQYERGRDRTVLEGRVFHRTNQP